MSSSREIPGAAFLMDRLMARVGLSGRSFIPLLSSFACAIPGIMATRAIADPKDRLTTILIAPLMTCSARLPVYAVIIAAFIPNARSAGDRPAGPGAVRALCRRHRRRVRRRAGAAPHGDQGRRLGLHHGTAQVPDGRRCATSLLGLWQRAWIFLRRAGTIIFTVTIVLWLLLSFPQAAPGESQVEC